MPPARKSGRSPPLSISRFVTNGLICGKPPAAPWKSVYHCLSYTWFLGMISVGWTVMMAVYLPRQMHSGSRIPRPCRGVFATQGRASKFQRARDLGGKDGREKTTKLYQAGRNFLFEPNGNCEFPLATSRWPLRSIMYLIAESQHVIVTRLFHTSRITEPFKLNVSLPLLTIW